MSVGIAAHNRHSRTTSFITRHAVARHTPPQYAKFGERLEIPLKQCAATAKQVFKPKKVYRFVPLVHATEVLPAGNSVRLCNSSTFITHVLGNVDVILVEFWRTLPRESENSMSKDTEQAINSYITDMQALEEHLEKAIGGQVKNSENDESADELRHVHSTIQRHIVVLNELSERRQIGAQGLSKTVKNAAASVLGLGAAAIDAARSDKSPKNLRDDYAALSLASIGYVMLHTAALALGDVEVATVALSHLQNHANSARTLHNIVPRAVIRFLKDEGLPADASVLSDVSRNIEHVWQSQDNIPEASAGSSRAGSSEGY